MAVAAPSPPRTVRLAVTDDLHRNRLTVFFRLLLAIPHLVWMLLWGFAVAVAAIVLWIAVLIKAQAPPELHNFVASYIRYATHVNAYVFLTANPYPGFFGRPGYPVDVVIAPPERQSRWSAGFRLILALPAVFLAGALGAGYALSPIGAVYSFVIVLVTARGAAGVAAFLSWFASLALGRTPRGLRDLSAFGLGYGAQAAAYTLLLTGRYPTSDPAEVEEHSELPEHPVRMTVTDDLGRPRLTVFFRLLLAIPHFVWLALWIVASLLAAIAAWFAALATGRVPATLHRFLAAYVRYATHVSAYVHLVGRRFPGFTGRAGSYGIDLEIAPTESQNRWKTLFRIFLALPALLVAGALGGVAFLVAVLAWWFALVTGRMPEGLRNLGASCLRYGAQTLAYVFLLTERYPYAAPVLRERREVEAEPEELPPTPQATGEAL